MDESLKEYVRVSERLRQRDLALTASLQSLNRSVQNEARLFQTLSSALTAGHDIQTNSIRNIK